jgi:hypothetical protein
MKYSTEHSKHIQGFECKDSYAKRHVPPTIMRCVSTRHACVHADIRNSAQAFEFIKV